MSHLTIPQVRAHIDYVLGHLTSMKPAQVEAELKFIKSNLFRRKHGRVAPPRSKSMTPAIAANIRHYAAAHPSASHQQIANACGVNPGRVSEVLNGKRK